MHYVKYAKYWGTEHFRTAGQHFQQNGYYCPFPEGTIAHREYWDEHEYYIRNGFAYEGQEIAGLGYLYVNFCPIWRKKEKKYDFPNFRSPDMEWFDEIEKAMAIGPYAGNFDRPSVHGTGKTRQSGHSLKGCVPLIYNTHFAPGTKNYLGSYDKQHAIKTNNMFMTYRRHLFEHTDFRKRIIKTEADDFYMFGYKKKVNGVEIDAGYMTELRIVSFQDKTTKGVGGGCDLFVIEEAGTFPKLVEAIQYIQDAVKDGDLTTGTILVYGAAGNLQDSMQYEKLAMNPEAFDAFAYDNKWDPEGKRKVIYFVPNYSCREPYIDKDGNPMEKEAIVGRDRALDKLKHTDYTAYLQKLSQQPNNLREMFDVRAKTRFDRDLIAKQIAKLENNEGLQGIGVECYYNGTEWTWRPSDGYVIRDYPLRDVNPDHRIGTAEMYEAPVKHSGPPGTRYIGSIDSYNFDDSENTDSFGSLVLKELPTSLEEGLGNRVVIELISRPPTDQGGKQKWYRMCADILLTYNAKVLVENEDNELVSWFYNQELDHHLFDQPDLIRNYIPKSTVKRAKGIHADEALIVAADNKLDRMMRRRIGYERDAEGKIVREILNIETIRSLGFLREAYRYVRLKELNFDRIRSWGWMEMLMEEIGMSDQKKEDKPNETTDWLARTSRSSHGNKGLPPGFNSYTRTA
jgi:hypothetical protein